MKKGLKTAILTLGLSALLNIIITVFAWANSDWDRNAPVRMGYFVAVNVIWAVAILYIIAKILWLGTPGVLR